MPRTPLHKRNEKYFVLIKLQGPQPVHDCATPFLLPVSEKRQGTKSRKWGVEAESDKLV
jgi:hypothetical protein